MSPSDSTEAFQGSPYLNRDPNTLLPFPDKLPSPVLDDFDESALKTYVPSGSRTTDPPADIPPWPTPEPPPNPTRPEDSSFVPEDFLVNREVVLDFWLCLTTMERRLLAHTDKAACLEKLRKAYSDASCKCDGCRERRYRTLCYRMFERRPSLTQFVRSTVEANLERRYDDFTEELEDFAKLYYRKVRKAVISRQPDPSLAGMYPGSFSESTPNDGPPVPLVCVVDASERDFSTLGLNLSSVGKPYNLRNTFKFISSSGR